MNTSRLAMDCSRAPSLGAPARVELDSAFRVMHTLEDVVRWGLGCDPQKPIVEVVVQDEYTHDVIVEIIPGDCYAVFDTT